jgi:hypothetical protein
MASRRGKVKGYQDRRLVTSPPRRGGQRGTGPGAHAGRTAIVVRQRPPAPCPRGVRIPAAGGSAQTCPAAEFEIRARDHRSLRAAVEDGDTERVVALLTEDAWLTMPPEPFEYQGPHHREKTLLTA